MDERPPGIVTGKKRIVLCRDVEWIKSLNRSKKTNDNYYKWRTEANVNDFLTKISNKLKSEKYYIRKNNFPYDIPGEHYVMWLQNEWYYNEDFVVSTLEKKFPRGNIKVFLNPVGKQSMPTIPHAHIFLNEKKICTVQ
jgi:hypothetical protein